MVPSKKNGKRDFYPSDPPPLLVIIFGQNLMCISWMSDQILGLLKSFAFVKWGIRGAFFKKGTDQANRGQFYSYRVSKKCKMALFWYRNEIYGCDPNITSFRKCCLCDVEHLWTLFQKLIEEAHKTFFWPNRVSK